MFPNLLECGLRKLENCQCLWKNSLSNGVMVNIWEQKVKDKYNGLITYNFEHPYLLGKENTKSFLYVKGHK